jgi:hypothetical protein
MRNRDEQYGPTDIINDENGNALNEPHLVLNRGGNTLKNSSTCNAKDNQATQPAP